MSVSSIGRRVTPFTLWAHISWSHELLQKLQCILVAESTYWAYVSHSRGQYSWGYPTIILKYCHATCLSQIWKDNPYPSFKFPVLTGSILSSLLSFMATQEKDDCAAAIYLPSCVASKSWGIIWKESLNAVCIFKLSREWVHELLSFWVQAEQKEAMKQEYEPWILVPHSIVILRRWVKLNASHD